MTWQQYNTLGIEPITCMADLQERISRLGFLPMFCCGIRGYSVYESTPDFWTDDGDNPWEWKGPIIRTGECIYGKFFNHKAVWISRRCFPDFINYRRTKHLAPNEDMSALDEIVLQTISSEGIMTSKAIAEMLGLSGKKRKRQPGDLVDSTPVGEKVNLDPILSRLMMEGRVVIADFIYNFDRRGKRYGWGIAQYTTPENLYGDISVHRSPRESYNRIFAHLKATLPAATETQIRKLLG